MPEPTTELLLLKAEACELHALDAIQENDKLAWLRLRDRCLERAIELENSNA